MGAVAGRGAELSALAAGLRVVAGGQRWSAIVTGEAGIGKSTLVGALADLARGAGFDILIGTATELDRARAFGPLVDAMGGPVADDDGSDDVVDVPFVAADALLARIESMVSTPTLLLLEDLHWADALSIGFVRDLTRRLADVPLAVVVTRRSGAGPVALDRLAVDLTREGAVTIDLGPLDSDAIGDLARGLLGARPGPRLCDALEASGGNPLFVVELATALRDEGVLHDDAEGTVDLDPAALVLPAGIRQTLLRRITTIAPTTLDLLRVASVLGQTFRPADLALVLGRPVVSLLGALQDAIASGIVEDAGERLAFRHDLVRDALYLDIPEPTRAELHLEVHRVLEVAGAPAHRLVPHLVRGVIDAGGCDRLIETGRALRDRAPGLATAALERALELLRDDDPRHDRAATAILIPLVLQGRPGDAADLAAAILGRDHDPALDDDLVEGQTFAVLRTDTPLTHRAEVERSLALGGLSDAARGRLMAFLAEACLMTGDAADAGVIGEAVRGWAATSGDDEVLVYVLGTLAWAACALGDVDRGLAMAKAAVARRETLDAPRFNVDLHLGVLHLEADELDDATARLSRGLRHDTARGDRAAIAYYHFGLVGAGYVAGRWDDAAADAEAGLALVDEGTAPANVSMLGRGLLARLALHRGDLASADELLRRSEADLASRGPQIGADTVLWTRALLFEANGNLPAAAALLGFEWDAMVGMRYFLSWRSTAPDLIRLYVATGELGRATRVADDAEEGARRAVGIHSAAATARRCRGLVEGDPDALVEAVSLYRKSPRVVDTAAALEDAGAALTAGGRGEEAVALLREALERFDALGATFDANRVAARLRTIGIRQPRRTPRAESGWESLTPTEARVVALVSSGLTNREIAEQLFVSRYTVETHVKHVFAKLGVSSRVELATAALRREG